jgi:hypothetical protein
VTEEKRNRGATFLEENFPPDPPSKNFQHIGCLQGASGYSFDTFGAEIRLAGAS